MSSPQLTVVEADDHLAQHLAARMAGSTVTVIHADATRLSFESWRFDCVLALTMLHHVPFLSLQDPLFGEACRVLRPGGAFIGVDSRDSAAFQEPHRDDTCVPIDPGMLSGRLAPASSMSRSTPTTTPRAFVGALKRWTPRRDRAAG